jgi:hypothetical protein
LLIWEAKARFAFHSGGSLPANYFQSTSWEFTHVGYPQLLPLTEAWCYLWMGEPNQFWVKAIFPAFYLAGVVLLAAATSRIAARRWVGPAIAALLFFVPYVTSLDGGVVVGYADFPLAVFYFAAIGYLLSFLTNGQPEAFRLYAACLMFLPWMKREGVILWVVAAACGGFVAWRGKRSLLLWLLPGALIIIAWRIFLAAAQARVPSEYLPATFKAFVANLDRLGPISAALLGELARFDHWNIFWPLVLIALVAVSTRARDRRLLHLLIAAITVPPAAYCGAYIFSNWPDYLTHMSLSLPRLLLQLMPVGWLIIALALRRTPSADQPSITSSDNSLTSAAPERGK